MKVSTIITAAAVLVAPVLGQYPTCALSITDQLMAGTGCKNSITDLKCVCKSAKFAQNLVTLVPTVCNAADTQTIKTTWSNMCKSIGYPITWP